MEEKRLGGDSIEDWSVVAYRPLSCKSFGGIESAVPGSPDGISGPRRSENMKGMFLDHDTWAWDGIKSAYCAHCLDKLLPLMKEALSSIIGMPH